MGGGRQSHRHPQRAPCDDGGRGWSNTIDTPRNARDGQQPAEAGKGREGFFSKAFRGNTAPPTLQFQTFGLQNSRENTYVVLSLLVCGNLLRQSEKTTLAERSLSFNLLHLKRLQILIHTLLVKG